MPIGKRNKCSAKTCENPQRSHLWGFSIPSFCGKAQPHRLVTGYSSPSSHLKMKWQSTPAMTVMLNEISVSTKTPPSCCQYRGGNKRTISYLFYINNPQQKNIQLKSSVIFLFVYRKIHYFCIFMLIFSPSSCTLR